ncbi:hypothetical protein [Listeria booriae]|uniref:hypothetical protein n=1 Tax=Listeria booriae TaxID=1552123 RepID=UPI00164CEC19|nr:hypothetical protein [Listeria booriae]MBC6300335.1 hypothetical protein [Listeria booriae]
MEFIGAIAFITGIVLLILAVRKKKSLKLPLVVLACGLVIGVIGAAISPDSKNTKDENKTKTEEVKKTPTKDTTTKTTKIDDATVITQVKYYISKYDKIDDIKWSNNRKDYNIKKMPKLKSTDDGKVFSNVYSAYGSYSWKDKVYDYTIIMNFPNKNNSQLITLDTDMGTNFEIPNEVVK